MRKYLGQLPSWQQILPVYAMIVLVVYTWTILWFFWKLPSWTFFLNVGEMLTMLAYSLAVNFAESLAVLCGPLLLSLVLPRKWFHDVFVARGAAISLAALGYMILLADQFRNKDDYPTLYLQIGSVALALAVVALIAYIGGRVSFIRSMLESVADRATIFIYILVPLSVIAVLFVAIRALG